MQPLFIEENTTPLFSKEQIKALDLQRIPQHVAIIGDGNRRWAKSKGSEPIEGHRYGADNVQEIVEAAKELTINTLTLFGFSTENWNRTTEEVEALLCLIECYLIEKRSQMIANGVHLRCIGNIPSLPDTLQKAIKDTSEATAHCNEINLILAINYGSRNEITRAVNSILEDIRLNKLPNSPIDEKTINSYLDTGDLPELDLFIRPGKEHRLSNFLLWQASYSELYFLDKMWPDFKPTDLYEAVLSYQKRQRRQGS